jgi:peptidoglycan lytic transglycosylase
MSARPARARSAPPNSAAVRPAAAASAPTRPTARRAAARRRAIRRRRLGFGAGLALLLLLTGFLLAPAFRHAVRELNLPLRHEDIIRQQAARKDLDPALLAAVIYAESKFREGQVSPAGARGLMQITPTTAQYIAHLSGGTSFETGDLASPQINIAYGSFYLRYLLRRKYGDNVVLAVAAYNAGEANVDRWVARRGGGEFRVADIPFPETRAYVDRVLEARRDYRSTYGRELGLRS